MKKIALVVAAAMFTSACAPNVDRYKANAYSTNQINQRQEMQVVNILSVTPAQVEVDNSKNSSAAKTFGSILGAVAVGLVASNNSGSRYAGATGAVGGAALGGAIGGAIASDRVMVEGVTLGYQMGDKLFTSSQVGQMCEFKQGTAMMIGSGNETRIQPNASCPKE